MQRDGSPTAAVRPERDVPPEALHDELVKAVAREAARDAENVAAFLRELGFVPTAAQPVRLPSAFLLHLGAALRLWVWDASGLRVQQGSKLPRAEQAIVDAFGTLAHESGSEGPHPVDLSREVIGLFARRFAWHGRRDLNADVVLDDHDDEDALVEALADLLWDARHARSRSTKPLKETSDG